jgi:hypothetical protein
MLSEHTNDDRALDLRNPEKMVPAKLVLVRKQALLSGAPVGMIGGTC